MLKNLITRALIAGRITACHIIIHKEIGGWMYTTPMVSFPSRIWVTLNNILREASHTMIMMITLMKNALREKSRAMITFMNNAVKEANQTMIIMITLMKNAVKEAIHTAIMMFPLMKNTVKEAIQTILRRISDVLSCLLLDFQKSTKNSIIFTT